MSKWTKVERSNEPLPYHLQQVWFVTIDERFQRTLRCGEYVSARFWFDSCFEDYKSGTPFDLTAVVSWQPWEWPDLPPEQE